MTFFRNKFPFSRPKFLMTFLFFSHRPCFRIFPIFFLIIHAYVKCRIWPFFTRKTAISENNSLATPFLLFSYFPARPTTLFHKILRGTNHGPSPPQFFLGGPFPQSP